MDWQQPSSSSRGMANSSANNWTALNQDQTLQYPAPSTSTNNETGTIVHPPTFLSNLTPAQTALYHATQAMHDQTFSLPIDAQKNIHALISTLWNADIDDMSTREEAYLEQDVIPRAEVDNALALKTAFVEFLFNAMKEEGVGRNEMLCLLAWIGEVATGTWEGIVEEIWEAEKTEDDFVDENLEEGGGVDDEMSELVDGDSIFEGRVRF